MSITKDPKHAPPPLPIIAGRFDCLLAAIMGPTWRGSEPGEVDPTDFIER